MKFTVLMMFVCQNKSGYGYRKNIFIMETKKIDCSFQKLSV